MMRKSEIPLWHWHWHWQRLRVWLCSFRDTCHRPIYEKRVDCSTGPYRYVLYAYSRALASKCSWFILYRRPTGKMLLNFTLNALLVPYQKIENIRVYLSVCKMFYAQLKNTPLIWRRPALCREKNMQAERKPFADQLTFEGQFVLIINTISA